MVLNVVLIAGVAGMAYILQGLYMPKEITPPPDSQWRGPGTPEKEDTSIRPFKIHVSDKVIKYNNLIIFDVT